MSNPEFLAEGSAVADFMSPDRIVVGAFADEDGERVVELHGAIETQVVRTDVPSAELVKLAANAFLSTRISFINEIANVCELVGADVVDVARGVGLDHRLGPHFLRAGIGFGGSCFPKDVTALKQLAGNSGYQFLLLQAVWEVNELQKRRVVQAAEASRAAARQEDRTARPRVQAEHGRHARGAEPRDRVPAALRRGGGPRVGPGGASRATDGHRPLRHHAERCATPTPPWS